MDELDFKIKLGMGKEGIQNFYLLKCIIIKFLSKYLLIVYFIVLINKNIID